MRDSKSDHSKAGFTLVELLIVIVVIAILAAITIIAYNGVTNKAKVAASISAAQQAAKKVSLYHVSNGQYPATLADADVPSSGSTSYQYTANETGGDYCITATSNGISSNVGGFGTGVNPAASGPCPGHTGTALTTLANGSSCPTGYIVVPGNSTFGTTSFCVMKYEAKNDGSGNAVSVAAGAPWVNISQISAISTSAAACSSCHLITEAEWMTIVANVMSVASNWSGGSVGSGYIYSGHNDNAPTNALVADSNDSNGYAGETNTGGNQRRTLTLTNGQVIWDLAGNIYEWTQGTIDGGQQPGLSGEVAYTWKQWNNSSLLMNGLPPLSRPSAISSAASGYSTSQGIGQLVSNHSETTTRAFRRGGSWDDYSYTGVLTLYLGYTPSYTSKYIGFRVVSNA